MSDRTSGGGRAGRSVDLSGIWKAARADDLLRRDYPDDTFDDRGWCDAPVPGHWADVEQLVGQDGPVLYRTHFEDRVGGPGERAWLVLDGVMYQSDVWLDGDYLGDTEGYFGPHEFEITEMLIEDGTRHLLAMEVVCPPVGDPTRKRTLTGVYQDWDCLDTSVNPGGIWGAARVEHTGPARIRAHRLVCTAADPSEAELLWRASVDAPSEGELTFTTRVTHEGVVLAEASEVRDGSGEPTEHNMTVVVPEPPLWWPRALGDQPLVDVTLEVRVDGRVSDAVTVTTGLRTVSLNRWVVSVNGTRLFCKGTNLGPIRPRPADVDGAAVERELALVCDANLDLVRVHGHVAPRELYEAADRLGLLVWQDFPLQWGYARTVRHQAVRQVADLVDHLGHHPSVVVWSCHNEPFPVDARPGAATPPARSPGRSVRRALAQQLPGYTKTYLDWEVRRAFARADPTRPAIAHSGVVPHLPRLSGTDSHLYVGWNRFRADQFEALVRTVPRLARFVSELGAPAPTDPAHSGAVVGSTQGGVSAESQRGESGWVSPSGAAALERLAPRSATPDAEAWIAEAQELQGRLLTEQIETLRRLKYRPCGGFAQFLFAEAQPGVLWSVLDVHRRPKAGYRALADACRPVLVVADRLPPLLEAGTPLAVDVHVISDLRSEIRGAHVQAVLRWTGGAHRWAFGGGVGADECARVGTLQFVAPETAGPVELELTLEWDDTDRRVVRNTYRGEIRPTRDGRQPA